MRIGIGIILGAFLVALPAGVALRRSLRAPVEIASIDPKPTEPAPGERAVIPAPASPDSPANSPMAKPRATDSRVINEVAPTTRGSSESADRPSGGRSAPVRPLPTAAPVSPASATQPAHQVVTTNVPPGLPDLPTAPSDEETLSPLSGQYLKGLVLRADKSPYQLTGRCEVLGRLEIEPGVVLWLVPEKHPGAKLVVQGTVRAVGRPDAPIVFAVSAGLRDDGGKNDKGKTAPPVILDSSPVSTPDDPEGWELAYFGLTNGSMIANQRVGKTRIRFSHIRGELRIGSQAGGITLEDSWFAGPHDLLLEAETISVRRIIVADTDQAKTKEFFVATAARLDVADARIHAATTRLLTRDHAEPALVLRDSILSATQLTIRLAGGCLPRVTGNNLHLLYRPQVVGRPAEHAGGVDFQGNYWEVRSPENDWPYAPDMAEGEEILRVQDQPRLAEPVTGYLWEVAISGKQ